ncbi:MAG: NAD-dependent epimerase/dehydratase family protein [Fidelibacterota bacterium]
MLEQSKGHSLDPGLRMSPYPHKIVVLGGGGFFASHLLSALKNSLIETELVVIDQVKQLPEDRQQEGVTYHLGVDLGDKRTIVGYLRGAAVAINAVGYVSFSRQEVQQLFRLNSELAVIAAEACYRAHVPWLVHISSVAGLGYRQGRGDPVHEEFEFDWDLARRKRKYYMLTKHEGDFLLDAFGDTPMRTIIYPGLMVGPGDRINTPRLLKVVKSPLCLSPPGGTNIVDVRDVAAGVAALLERGPGSGRFILGGENLLIADMFRRVREVLGCKGLFVAIPGWTRRPLTWITSVGETVFRRPIPLTTDNVDSMYEWRYFTSTRAEEVFGYQVRYSVEESFRDYLEGEESLEEGLPVNTTSYE